MRRHSLALACLLLGSIWSHQALGQVAVEECIREYVAKRSSDDALGIAPSDVESTIIDIAGSIGLNRQIDVVPCDLDVTAFAKGINEETDGIPAGEYLVYNNDWFESVGGKSINTAGIVVLSHELAHFLNSHFTTRRQLARIEQEKEADAFTGCAVARMNKDYAGLKDALERLRTSVATSRYPDEKTSVELATAMFTKCGGEFVPKPPVPDPALPLPLEFLQYEGPRYNATKQELKDDWPSGTWKSNENGTSQFLYSTKLDGFDDLKVTLNFFEKDDKRTRTTFFSRNRIFSMDASGFKEKITEGDSGKEYNFSCSTRFQWYQKIVAGHLGGIKDRPIEKKVSIADSPALTRMCDDFDYKCSYSGSETTTNIYFKNSKAISLNKRERSVHENGYVPTPGDRRKVTADELVCEIAIIIDWTAK